MGSLPPKLANSSLFVLHSPFFTLRSSLSSYSPNTIIFFTSGVMASMLWRYRVRLSKVRST